LFVHANIQHLLGNTAAMAVFGSGVAAAAGPGMSALLLVAAGALGNGLSGMVGTSYRLSIGASTAVFAGVGILAARQYVERLRVPTRRLGAWIPLGAALALLSLLGTDPRSDLKAHFFGLLAGLAVGGAHARLAPVAAGRVAQILAGGLAVGLAGAAWWAAFDH
jgi:membrane associated rhomboid family serine protease